MKKDEVELVVVWSGRDSLLGDRPQRPSEVWVTPVTRKYTRTGRYAKKKALPQVVVEQLMGDTDGRIH